MSFIDDYSKWTVIIHNSVFHATKIRGACVFTTVQGTCRKTCQCYAIGNLNVQEYHGDDATDADELAVKVLRSDNGGE